MDVTLSRYTDFLLSVPKYATATAMAAAFDHQVSHDKVSRWLMSVHLDAKSVWKSAKKVIRQQVARQDESGVLIVDDSIVEKAHTDENAMICYHYDHSLDRYVKGINFITLFYQHERLRLPIQVEVIEKTQAYLDQKSGKTKYRSPKTKNEHFRSMLGYARDQVGFRYVLGDSWFSSAENIDFITKRIHKHAILAIKSSRTVALSSQLREQGKFVAVDQLDQLQEGVALTVYLRSVNEPVRLVKQVFTNKDGSTGTLYLIATDLEMDYEQITTTYKRRWDVEEYHKSLKQHTALAGSPTKIIETQANHFYAAIIAFIKLETLKVKLGQGHFRLKAMLTLTATKACLSMVENWLA